MVKEHAYAGHYRKRVNTYQNVGTTKQVKYQSLCLSDFGTLECNVNY
jgi:hypothetical protein